MSHAAHLSMPVATRDHVQGAANAVVTLVEYGDYECPYCGKAYPIVKAVQKRLGHKLRFVFRNFPLVNSHPHAAMAAELAEVAAVDGKFWQMHDMLFENQDALDLDNLIGYANELDLDVERVAEALERHTQRARVAEDFASGERSGVNGTPTFFINGIRFDDSWDEATLTTALQAAAARR